MATIREANEDDAPELARLLTALGHATDARELRNRWIPWRDEGNSALVAARDDGSLSGVATLHRTWVLHRPRPVGRITALIVDEADRGRGIGRALVAGSEQWLTHAGCGLLEITSNPPTCRCPRILPPPRLRADQRPLHEKTRVANCKPLSGVARPTPMHRTTPTIPLAFALSALIVAAPVAAQNTAVPGAGTGGELAGLWQAKLRYGPDIRGTVIVQHHAKQWRADVAGYDVPVRVDGNTLTFSLPSEAGDFFGQFAPNRRILEGYWRQSRMVTTGGRVQSPCSLARSGNDEVWRGELDPLDDAFTMYLVVKPLPGGSTRAFLKNPERNIGWFTRVAYLERNDKTVRLLAEPGKDGKQELLAEGMFNAEDNVLSIPLRGGTYDFERLPDSLATDFYPRSFPGAGKDYTYREPIARDDGWPVATPESVGMSRATLEKFIRTCIDMPVDSVQSLDLHGVLVARHGKLVLEEYFHGENRDKPHDTRSAAKTITDVLAGAAMQSGVRLSAQSKVYEVMNGGRMPAGLEPRKQALTLENLLTMSSGLDMDDNDDNSKGNEDHVSDAGVKNLYAFTLALDMVRDPGASAIYASLSPNLAGGVIRAASGGPLIDLFRDLVAKPMQIHRYWFGMTGDDEPYMGGGARFLPRDFMKFGQLMLNGGMWNGHRILPRAWAERSTSHVVDINGRSPYGYLWWMTSTPYQGRRVNGYAALGNGGQNVIVIPELDLVVAFYCGNYNEKAMNKPIRHLLPEQILPAITGK